HWSVVRGQGDAKFLLIENLKRMLRQTGCCARMNVAEQADFQWNPLIQNILSQISKFHGLAVHHGYVIDEPGSVPDAVGSAVLDRLPDRFLPVTLPRVNRDVEIFALEIGRGHV